jgi:hypothetical protein
MAHAANSRTRVVVGAGVNPEYRETIATYVKGRAF